MKNMKTILAVLSAAVLTFEMNAQPLGDASCVSKGALPNGVQWYVVTNKALQGVADFALVQKDFREPGLSRSALCGVPHFGARRPVDFFSSTGVGYSRDGFISYGSGSTVFSFRNVPVTVASAVDSTLMFLTDLTATSTCPQAVIISGDVDAARMADRLSLLSMTVSPREKPVWEDTYLWEPSDTPGYYYSGNASDALASVRVSYSSPRVPRDRMNTLQPVVARKYKEYLASILKRRISDAFRSAGLPLADVRFRYLESADTPGDEQCTVTVMTSSAVYSTAVELLAGILSSLDTGGATPGEFSRAKALLLGSARTQDGVMDNAAWVDRCISAYLFNASLASESDIAAVFTSGRLSGERELELFNNYVGALLDPAANLTIGFDTPQAAEDADLAAVFESGWRKGAVPQAPGREAVTLTTPSSKVKIRSEAKEPVTGGSLWTFSNGMRVIFCKKPTPGKFSYAMMIRGGGILVEGLRPGESAFVGDMLGICDVAGAGGGAFRDSLLTRGITFIPRVSMNSLSMMGEAPSSEAATVLGALLSMASDRKVNREAFDYYRSCEDLKAQMRRLTDDGVRDELDSLMFPGWQHPSRKRCSALGDDLPERAEKFFSNQFSRCSDGVLVFMGDLDETALKKSLCSVLGDFRTGGKAPAAPSISRKTASGTTTRTEMAGECGFGNGSVGVWVSQSAVMPFSLKSHMSFRVAVDLLRESLAASLAPEGGYADVQYRQELYPDERIVLYVCVQPCRPDGLPEGVTPSDPLKLLGAVRSAMASLTSSVSPSRLKAAKARLASEVESELGNTESLMDYVLLRYGSGKDFVTDRKNAISAVDAASVDAVITALSRSGKIEMVLM